MIISKISFRRAIALCAFSACFMAEAAEEKRNFPKGSQTDGSFTKVILDADKDLDGNGAVEDSIKDPMEMAVAKDGRVFWAERAGLIKMYQPTTKTTIQIGQLPVFSGLEDGLLGITLDPKFANNGFIYLNRSLPETTKDQYGKSGLIRVSRFTLVGDKIDLASEKVMLDIPTQREQCCHVGGSLSFDANGNLYVSVGDNTNPFESDGFGPFDQRTGRSPWSAEKSSANPNDLRGKINRIHPEPNGTVTIPKGNLFPPGTPNTRPEIYVMGNRNPFRINIDQKNGNLYWGEVGPDAGGPNETRGPAGFDEINQARQAGFFGWPYFVGDSKPYRAWDFGTKMAGDKFDPLKPLNKSPFNTGIQDLPPTQPAFIYYPASPSTRFPVVGSGGRTAMAGPIYYFDPKLNSPHKLPKEYDHTLFIYEWSRNWIIAVHLDENDKIAKMEKFCENMSFMRPMDMELGADGCLYLIEFGTNWGNNFDTQIVRIEHNPAQTASK